IGGMPRGRSSGCLSSPASLNASGKECAPGPPSMTTLAGLSICIHGRYSRPYRPQRDATRTDGADVQETSLQQADVVTKTAPMPMIQTRSATVVAVVVTWNRKDMVSGVLKALVAQTRACSSLHVVVVDNASTD